MHVSALLGAVQVGRLLLLNVFQLVAFAVISAASLAVWSLTLLTLPRASFAHASTGTCLPHGQALHQEEGPGCRGADPVPQPPADLVLLMVTVHIPILMVALLFARPRTHDRVMRDTPRKRAYPLKLREEEPNL